MVLGGGPGEVAVVGVDPARRLAALEADVVVQAAPARKDPPGNAGGLDMALNILLVGKNMSKRCALTHL